MDDVLEVDELDSFELNDLIVVHCRFFCSENRGSSRRVDIVALRTLSSETGALPLIHQ